MGTLQRMDEEAELTRRTRFEARHAYRRPEWDDARNAEVFGLQSRPHGHTFTLDVSVRGPIDPTTGFAADLVALDRALDSLVAPLRGTLLNDAIEAFRDGRIQPTTEALARWAFRRLAGEVAPPARLASVRVAEDEDLWSRYEGP